MKPFSNSDDTVQQLWYPAAKGARTLPFPTSFGSLDWSSNPWKQVGVGEVYGASRAYNRARPRRGADGSHQCGTREDFRYGCIRDTSLPPVEYTSQLLPLCCGAPEVAGGGIVFGGTALGFLVADNVARGGIVFGGQAVPGDTYIDTSRGGIVWSGTAEVYVELLDLARGGVVWSGTAEQLVELLDTARGGIVWSGTAEQLIVIQDTARGGIVWSGTAEQSISVLDTARGGIVWSGTALQLVELIARARGGIVFSGTALQTLDQLDTARGGIVWSGTAIESVVHPVTPPNTTCATAITLTPGVNVTAPTPGLPATSLWYQFPIMSFTPFHVRVLSWTNVNQVHVWTGSSCGSRLSSFILSSPGCNTGFTGDPFGWVEVELGIGSTGSITFNMDNGFC